MHSESPAKVVEWFTETVNDTIAQVCAVMPERFSGIAGLAQSPELSPESWAKELRRCVEQLGFVGCLINPDPYEGTKVPPAMGEKYWYPIYEALCELDVPAMIHSGGCRPPARESYSLHFVAEETISVISLLQSKVFDDFPTLKLIVPHGGGAIPYQAGRFMSAFSRVEGPSFVEQVRQFWFDTCLYTQSAMNTLVDVVGADRLLLGTEKPGTGSTKRADGGWYDDVPSLVRAVPGLDDAAQQKILSGNAASLFKLETVG
jgi:4-oxalmesaconate hydratase